MDNERKFALLIDADNISPKYLMVMLAEAKRYGNVTIRRIYGDWTDNSKKTWKDNLLDYSIVPIQQYSYTTGKNSSNSAMIIDAMDILYSNVIDGFILVSSDSDFTRLAMRLREAGKTVIGMGEAKTPSAFVKACEEFKTLDVLFKNTLSTEEQKEVLETTEDETSNDISDVAPITEIGEIKKCILSILDEHSDENGRMLLSELGRLLTKEYPDFDERNYGKYKKFSQFVQKLSGCEIDMVYFEGENKPPLAYVKTK